MYDQASITTSVHVKHHWVRKVNSACFTEGLFMLFLLPRYTDQYV